MENVQDYTLTARRPTEPMYALIVIFGDRSLPRSDNGHVYMVEKVQPVTPADIEHLLPLLRRLSRFAISASRSTATQGAPPPSGLQIAALATPRRRDASELTRRTLRFTRRWAKDA